MKPKGVLIASLVLMATMAYAQQSYPSGRPYDQRPYDHQRQYDQNQDRYGRDYDDQSYVTGGVVPQGTEIRVRTDSSIQSDPAPNTRFSATVAEDVRNDIGDIVIPRGSRAQLVAVQDNRRDDTALDLESVTVDGRRYELMTRSAAWGSSNDGLGANQRTAKYVGGGAAVGAILGAIIGGGKGAAIGAVVGGAGGAGTQVYRGHHQSGTIPAETLLKYTLADQLELRPVRNNYRDRENFRRRDRDDRYNPPTER